MNAAWLRGTIAHLNWVLGDQDMAPLSGERRPLDPAATLAAPEPAIRKPR